MSYVVSLLPHKISEFYCRLRCEICGCRRLVLTWRRLLFSTIIFIYFSECIFSGSESMQKRSRWTATAQKPVDIVSEVSSQLFCTWRISILLQRNTWVSQATPYKKCYLVIIELLQRFILSYFFLLPDRKLYIMVQRLSIYLSYYIIFTISAFQVINTELMKYVVELVIY